MIQEDCVVHENSPYVDIKCVSCTTYTKEAECYLVSQWCRWEPGIPGHCYKGNVSQKMSLKYELL